MTGADRAEEDADAVAAICSVLSSLARGRYALDDEKLTETISRYLPEPSATDPRPVRARPAVVQSVAVQGIRSFGPEQTLRLSEGLTIVYAGNGRGKTSLSDAFELVTKGETTRSKGLPLATSEVKDKDHITHRTLHGIPDPVHPPRVVVRYRCGEELHDCEWTTFDSPALHHPDLQVLPRRLLRSLVNAKRTERLEPLGAALGLPETSASWTAIAKALGDEARAAATGGEPYLQLLARDVALDDVDEDARTAALRRWATAQKIQPEDLPAPPSATPWRRLADDLGNATSRDTENTVLGGRLTALLTAFVEVAAPDAHCPACAQAPVPQARLDEVRAILDASDTARRHAAHSIALTERRDGLTTQLEGWLDSTRQPERLGDSEVEGWRTALAALREVVSRREQLGDEPWARDVAEALEALDAARARLAHAGAGDTDPELRHAVDAITADADGTQKALQELEFRRDVLSPVLQQAQKKTKELLVARVEDEFLELEGPINDWLEILGPEGTPPISLAAKASTGRPSLDLLVADLPHGAKAPHATGYLSDAQLDMLGMSAHLARIERDHPGSTIVIDDPSDMLDSTSRKALASGGIARLLESDGSSAHQVVVLTHDDQLVRDLWDGHRYRRPATVQDTMEIHRSSDGADSYSVLTSRTTAQAAARARELKEDHWKTDRDRLWFRAAFASHTRQAAEMLAKDVDTLLGPAGIDLHPVKRAPDESKELGPVSDRVLATLRETTARWCEHGRHIPARSHLGEVCDLLSSSSTQFLNPGAHADVILPEASSTANILMKVSALAGLLAAPDDRPRSSWTTHSALAEMLRSGQDCPGCATDG